MPPPEIAETARASLARRNPWMDVALGLLWLFCVALTATRLWHRDEFARLGFFAAASAAYFIVTAGMLRSYYEPGRYRWYFVHQLLLLLVMVYAAPPSGYAWFLILPAASQAVLHLPLRPMAVVLLL